MLPDQEHRLEEIFSAARGLPPRERAAFPDRACGGNAELRRQAESLLGAHQQAGAFLQPTIRVAPPNAPTEKPSDRIGRYKLLEQIGEGGFGVVWMAEQEEPVRRRVALKIIKLGMDTKEVVVRFEAERQALALMDHPSIARVFDGGATDTGRPYFVMELVKGMPITEYCDAQRLPTRERLDLFLQVCQAVQHAHQKGVIHRDLKPSNVLVTVLDDRPVPKVIDFGIAKATQAQLADRSLDDVWLAISPDWQSAFSSRAGLVDLRDPRQPKPSRPVTADAMVNPVQFSPHGQLLAVGMGDNTVQLWRTDSGQRLGPPMKTTARVTWMQFSADGHLLITAESGEREPGAGPLVHAILRLWDTSTALPCGRPIPATALFLFTGARLSPDSRCLVIPTSKTTPATTDRPVPVLQVWPLPVSDVSLAEIQQRTESKTGMRLDAAGNVVATGTAPAGGVSGINAPQPGE